MIEKKLIEEQIKLVINFLNNKIYSHKNILDIEYSKTSEPVKYDERLILNYEKINIGDKWSNTVFECAWFHIKGKSDGNDSNYLSIDIEGEGEIYNECGFPFRSITNISSDFDKKLGSPGKKYIPFNEGYFNKTDIDLWIDGANNDLFGKQHSGTILDCSIVYCNEKIKKLYYDMTFLFDLYRNIENETPLQYKILYTLEKVSLMVCDDMSEQKIFFIEKILEPELSRKNIPETFLKFYAIGHSHLDLAWLWPIRETKRKAVRTFSTAIANLKRYPNYIYGASQPQQFLWVKEAQPLLFEEIKKYVKSGRLECQGAMWVEADINITGGESLIRQFIYGKKFFYDEFGKDIDIVWLPDVFGFSGALPQIMKICETDKLLTTKMSWNLVNQFPYNSFRWKGIDGSEVLVHIPPEGTYNSSATPSGIIDAQRKYKEKGLTNKACILFGIGDGGAGAGESHLEMMKRNSNVYGLPEVCSSTSKVFFDELEKDSNKLPEFKGEMYLEKHQGTYTSQSLNKFLNRKLENTALDTEFLCSKIYGASEKYPKHKIEKLWKKILLFQFHDILPGSCIKRVYDESIKEYNDMIDDFNDIQKKAFEVSKCKLLTGINTTSFKRKEYLEINNKIYVIDLEPYSCSEFSVFDKNFNYVNTSDILENKNIKLLFDKDGNISEIYDKKNKRKCIEKKSNILAIFNDIGDAWDMYPIYIKQDYEIPILSDISYKTNSVCAERIQILKYNKSKIKESISLSNDSKIINIDIEIEWNESSKMLRSIFYPSIMTNYCFADIQFGSIKRSTTENNSIEKAQFEICAHKWIDVSEPNYGFAIMNKGKYGYRVKNNEISINLLRSQNYPCKNQDIGKHKFSYAIYPHDKNIEDSDVRKQAYLYNRPVIIGNVVPFSSMFKTTDERIIIESIKISEDNKVLTIRVYNDSEIIRYSKIISNYILFETNCIERRKSNIIIDEVIFKPYEIKTFLCLNSYKK